MKQLMEGNAAKEHDTILFLVSFSFFGMVEFSSANTFLPSICWQDQKSYLLLNPPQAPIMITGSAASAHERETRNRAALTTEVHVMVWEGHKDGAASYPVWHVFVIKWPQPFISQPILRGLQSVECVTCMLMLPTLQQLHPMPERYHETSGEHWDGCGLKVCEIALLCFWMFISIRI